MIQQVLNKNWQMRRMGGDHKMRPAVVPGTVWTRSRIFILIRDILEKRLICTGSGSMM